MSMLWSGKVYIYVLVGERVDLYALVGIRPRSGYRRLDKRRSGKRRSALNTSVWLAFSATKKRDWTFAIKKLEHFE